MVLKGKQKIGQNNCSQFIAIKFKGKLKISQLKWVFVLSPAYGLYVPFIIWWVFIMSYFNIVCVCARTCVFTSESNYQREQVN